MKTLTRVFKHGSAELPDPNSTLTPEDVRDVHSIQYPELATAALEGPVTEGDKLVFTYSTRVGTKG